MKSQEVALVLLSFLVTAAAKATAQQLTVAHAGVVRSRPPLDQTHFAALRVASSDEGPPRWPFVIGGALIGGVAAGAWYAHQVAKSDDAIIDLSMPVVAVGIGVGAFTGFLVGEIVRAVHSPAPYERGERTRPLVRWTDLDSSPRRRA